MLVDPDSSQLDKDQGQNSAKIFPEILKILSIHETLQKDYVLT